MKILVTILILFFGGDLSFSSAQTQTSKASENAFGLSDSELTQIRERSSCLQPGMTKEDVFGLLGIDLNKRAFSVSGSGPTGDLRLVYYLTVAPNENGFNFLLVLDKANRMKRAEIICWKESKKCFEDVEKLRINLKEDSCNFYKKPFQNNFMKRRIF